MPVSSLCGDVIRATACSSGTILVQAMTVMHYTGAVTVVAPFGMLIKSIAYMVHYFGTLNAVVFVTRPGQTGRF